MFSRPARRSVFRRFAFTRSMTSRAARYACRAGRLQAPLGLDRGEVGLPELGRVADGLGALQCGAERRVGLVPLPTGKRNLTLEPPASHQVLARIGSGCELQALLRELPWFFGIATRQPELSQAREEMRGSTPLHPVAGGRVPD